MVRVCQVAGGGQRRRDSGGDSAGSAAMQSNALAAGPCAHLCSALACSEEIADAARDGRPSGLILHFAAGHHRRWGPAGHHLLRLLLRAIWQGVEGCSCARPVLSMARWRHRKGM